MDAVTAVFVLACMRLRDITLTLVVVLASSTPAFGQRVLDRYDRILVPVLPLPHWSAQLWIRNEGNEHVDIFPLARDADSPSRGQLLPLPEPGVSPGQTLEYRSLGSVFPLPYYVPVTSTFAGGILYVEKDKLDDVRFQLRVGETQIPIVSERVFSNSPLSLLRISVSRGKRYTLRVYSLDTDSSEVEVRFEPLVGGPAVASEVLRLQRPDARARCASEPCPWPKVPFVPSYGAFFFDTVRVPNWIYRITVTSTSAAKIWTFLSVTEPITREIEIYTPN